MLLPIDDSFELDIDNDGPLVIDRNDPLTVVPDKLLEFLPGWARQGTSAVRDAWLQAWVRMYNTIQARIGFVLEAQASPRFGEGIWLDAFGELIGRPRVVLESDNDYRVRLLIPVDLVSPIAIKTVVNKLVAEVSSVIVIYNETAVDMAFCGPATISDPQNPNSEQQTIATLQTWFAFTQPEIQPLGAAPNQSIYDGVSVRLWATYPALNGSKTGAFAVPANGAGFFIIIPGDIQDTSLEPRSEYIAFSDPGFVGTIGLDDPKDFTQGITGSTSPNQSSILGNPSQVPYNIISYGYISAATDSLFDKIDNEVERRKAAGVPFTVMIDFLSQNSF